MTTVDRINAYAQTPQSVPVARYHIGSALLLRRAPARAIVGAEQQQATRTLWRRMARIQTRARNRLDWTQRDRSEDRKHTQGETGSALLFALLLVTACFLTAIGIGAELLARAQGIG